jgi:hypothetical protein
MTAVFFAMLPLSVKSIRSTEFEAAHARAVNDTSLKPRAENARGGAEEPKVVAAVVEVAGVDFG